MLFYGHERKNFIRKLIYIYIYIYTHTDTDTDRERETDTHTYKYTDTDMQAYLQCVSQVSKKVKNVVIPVSGHRGLYCCEMSGIP
jgi:hypothetical protein